MADLNAILNTISTAVYGEDVRQGIYDGIKFIHDEYENVKDVAAKVQSLIDIYDQAVADAKALTGTLKDQITTGTSLKNDLSGLSVSLSDGRQVLADLQSENQKATSALTEAREKIPILQDLLSRIPDLSDAERITSELETAYNNANKALEELNCLTGTIEELKSLNQEASQNLSEYQTAKGEIESITQSATEAAEKLNGADQVIQALNDAYQKVSEKTVDLEELNRILTEIDSDVQIINDNKEAMSTLALNIEIIKQVASMDLSQLTNLEERVSKLETTLAGLEETLEILI